MCTVSVIPLGADALRLACNRDELRTRAIAHPPTIQTFGERRAILPTDPDGGGTWIAVNDAGVVFTLLNANPPNKAKQTSTPRSRGEIIPRLAGHATVSAALGALSRIRASEYRPFRLVMFDSKSFADALSNGYRFDTQIRRWGRDAQLFSSSGLGDQLVQGPRRKLFEEVVLRADDPIRAQDAFHAHTWPDRPHLSVLMSREDARTVSCTVVEVRLAEARLHYHDEVTQSDSNVSLPLVCAQ
jgi:hypothetical protein